MSNPMLVKAILRVESLHGTFVCEKCSTTQKVTLGSIPSYCESITVACMGCGREYCYKLPSFTETHDVTLRGPGNGQ
jgi:hypothetical protein